MTKHTIITFQLARSGVALIVAGALVIAVLLVAAGYIAGMAVSSKAAVASGSASATALAPVPRRHLRPLPPRPRLPPRRRRRRRPPLLRPRAQRCPRRSRYA